MSLTFLTSLTLLSFVTSTVGSFTHLMKLYGIGSSLISQPYSFSSLYLSTSNCSTPTTPTMISESPAVYSWNIWIAPSWAICVTPFTNCFRFILLSCTTLQKCSGANVGMPSYSNFLPPVVSVSPMENRSGSNTPITSPA